MAAGAPQGDRRALRGRRIGEIDIFHTFAPDHPDVELGELPNVCSHFAVFLRPDLPVRAARENGADTRNGLNDVAIGIEHVGFSDGDVMDNRRERRRRSS